MLFRCSETVISKLPSCVVVGKKHRKLFCSKKIDLIWSNVCIILTFHKKSQFWTCDFSDGLQKSQSKWNNASHFSGRYLRILALVLWTNNFFYLLVSLNKYRYLMEIWRLFRHNMLRLFCWKKNTWLKLGNIKYLAYTGKLVLCKSNLY